MNLLKTVAGRVAGGMVVLAVLAGGIAWWQADQATRHDAAALAGRSVAWLAMVLALPWLLFAVIGWAAKRDTNWAGVLLVGGLTLAEAAMLSFVTHLRTAGTTVWMLAAAAIVVAGVYNLLTCDWIAEKFE